MRGRQPKTVTAGGLECPRCGQGLDAVVRVKRARRIKKDAPEAESAPSEVSSDAQQDG